MVRPSHEEQPQLWIEEAPPVEEARPEAETEERGVEVVFPLEDETAVISIGGNDDGDC